jgi:integrase
MPRIKLTQRTVDRLPAPDPSGRQVLHFDEDLKGFAVLCSGATNAKSYVVERDLPGGKTRRVTVGPCNVFKLEAARKQAQGVLAQFYAGVDPKQGRRGAATLRQVLEDYLEARKDLRKKSKRMYRIAVERYLSGWLNRPLREITPEMVEQRHSAIADEVERGGRYKGQVAANFAMITLRILWNFAADRLPDLPANPVRRLQRAWFPEQRRERHVRADQLPAFYAAIKQMDNHIARDFLVLLLFTGLRLGEASTLTWDDVNFHDRTIRVPAARTKAGRKLDLPMVDVAHGMLVARRSLGNGGFVFPGNGRAGHIVDLQTPLRQIEAATGIKVSPHDLRRTYVTVAESTEISPLHLKALVNHSLGGGITEGYVQMSVERLREPAQRVCEMDGNLTCMKHDGVMVTEVHWQGKFRGPDFAAIPFLLQVGKTNKLKDSKGRHIWTVTARPISAEERDAAENLGRQNQDKLLVAMLLSPGASLSDLAKALCWFHRDGKPYKSQVQRVVNTLQSEGLVKKENRRWTLTKSGDKAARAAHAETSGDGVP